MLPCWATCHVCWVLIHPNDVFEKLVRSRGASTFEFFFSKPSWISFMMELIRSHARLNVIPKGEWQLNYVDHLQKKPWSRCSISADVGLRHVYLKYMISRFLPPSANRIVRHNLSKCKAYEQSTTHSSCLPLCRILTKTT